MRSDRSSESYRALALQAEHLAETYARAAVWRQIVDDMRVTALRLFSSPRPAVEMGVAG